MTLHNNAQPLLTLMAYTACLRPRPCGRGVSNSISNLQGGRGAGTRSSQARVATEGAQAAGRQDAIKLESSVPISSKSLWRPGAASGVPQTHFPSWFGPCQRLRATTTQGARLRSPGWPGARPLRRSGVLLITHRSSRLQGRSGKEA